MPGIPPAALWPLFALLLSLYRPVLSEERRLPEQDRHVGAPLAVLLQQRFTLFSTAALPHAEALLAAICAGQPMPPASVASPLVNPPGLWRPAEDLTWLEQWDQFARYLQHERRFLLDESSSGIRDPRLWLPPLLPQLEATLPAGQSYYCGRHGRHTLEAMGAPPPEQTPAGRANPRGIPFLYLSTTVPTVIAELRPWKGQVLSIAAFVLREAVRSVDLSQLPRLETPFGPAEGLDLARRAARYQGLEQVEQVLSHPIDQEQAELEYLPTQYLTEIIRHAGYDGMSVRSALGPGQTLVLFAPAKAEARQVRQVQVSSIHYRWHAVLPSCEPAEEGSLRLPFPMLAKGTRGD